MPSGKNWVSLKVGNWKTGEEDYFPPKNGRGWTEEERLFHEKKIKDASKIESQEKESQQLKTAEEAENLYKHASVFKEGETHPYLIKKGFRDLWPNPVKFSGETLLVPMRDEKGKTWGLQRIFANGDKKYLPRQKTKACFFPLNGDSRKCFVCEGFATGLSIYVATGYQVYIAFTANNLLDVTKIAKSYGRHGEVIIAGDEDKWGEKNIGREKAEEAAFLTNSSLVFPDFSSVNFDTKPTDFNDLMALGGLDELKRQLMGNIQKERNPNSDASGFETTENREHATGHKANNWDDRESNNHGDGNEKAKRGDKEIAIGDDLKIKKKKISQEKIEALGKGILDCRFKLFVDSQKTILYNITDVDNDELEICENDDYLLRRLKKNIEEKWGKTPDENLVKKVFTSWKLSTETLKSEPKSFAWENDPKETWSFKRLDFNPSEGEYDSWKEFLYRLSSPEDFMAFIWSIFEEKNRSRQILYLYDPVGETGKSTVIRALGWVFGNSFSAINNTMVSGAGNRWLLGQLYGKRLIAWADCKNPKFCMSETARNISSGDPVPIEFKGGHPFQAEMYAKLILGSNHSPEITSGGADTSRLMVIKVDENKINKDDPGWENRLKKELPYFLWECKKHYDAKCPKHGKITLSEETQHRVIEASIGFEERWEALSEKRLVFGENHETSVVEWTDLCKEERLDNNEIGNFKDYLKRRPGVFIGKKRDGGNPKMRYVGFRVRIGNFDL